MPAKETMSTSWGAAVVHGDTAYFSEGNSVYSYDVAEDDWTELLCIEYKFFGLGR